MPNDELFATAALSPSENVVSSLGADADRSSRFSTPAATLADLEEPAAASPPPAPTATRPTTSVRPSASSKTSPHWPSSTQLQHRRHRPAADQRRHRTAHHHRSPTWPQRPRPPRRRPPAAKPTTHWSCSQPPPTRTAPHRQPLFNGLPAHGTLLPRRPRTQPVSYARPEPAPTAARHVHFQPGTPTGTGDTRFPSPPPTTWREQPHDRSHPHHHPGE